MGSPVAAPGTKMIVEHKKQERTFGSKEKTDASGKSIKRRFSFNLKKAVLRRSITPMKQRRPSDASTSLSSVCSSDLGDAARCVRFAVPENSKKRSKKVKTEVITFDKTTKQEMPHVWYSDNDMMETMEEIKHIVKHYVRKCDRYRAAMEMITDKCMSASQAQTAAAAAAMECGESSEETSEMFSAMSTTSSQNSSSLIVDARIMEQVANADARGLEQHIAPRMHESRRDIVRAVLQAQDALYYEDSQDREAIVAATYATLSRPARLLAQTMGEGDALVAVSLRKEASS